MHGSIFCLHMGVTRMKNKTFEQELAELFPLLQDSLSTEAQPITLKKIKQPTERKEVNWGEDYE